MRRFPFISALGASCLVMTCLAGSWWMLPALFERPAQAQTQDKSKSSKSKVSKSTSKKKPISNVQGLDVRAEQAQASFIKEAEDLATEYIDAGHLEKAKSLLQSALTLKPEADEIKDKIKQLDETILTSNDFEVDVNVARMWEPANATVFESHPIRFQVEGTYRYVSNLTLGAAGIPDADPVKEMVAGIPCGALMGVIATADGKMSKPFAIGEGRDFTPKETGLLFLRVNCPPDNKNVGKLKVLISGYVKSGTGGNAASK